MEVCFSVSLFLSFKSPQRIKECEVYTSSKSIDFPGLALAIAWRLLMHSPGHRWICPLCPPGWTTARNSNYGFLSERLPRFPASQPEACTAESLSPASDCSQGAAWEQGQCRLWTMPPAMQTSQSASSDINGRIKTLIYWKAFQSLRENSDTFQRSPYGT